MGKLTDLLQTKNTQWKSRIFVILGIVYALLIVDISIGNISDFDEVRKFASSIDGIIVFVSMAATFVIGQQLVLKYLRISEESQTFFSSKIRLAHIVYGAQYGLAIIIIAVTLQILFSSSYYTIELMIAVPLGYGVAVLMMGALCHRLFKWFIYNKSAITLIFAITAFLITLNALISFVLFEERLSAKRSVIIDPNSEVVFDVGFDQDNPMYWVVRAQTYTMVGYFIAAWGGTVLLLLHHIKRVGRPLFGTLVALPLVLFVYLFIYNFPLTNPESEITQVLTAGDQRSLLIYTYSIIFLGILIGIGYYSVGKAVRRNIDVRNYMLITAFGFALYFNAAQATVIQAGYPPFSLFNVSFVGLSSFLIFLGLYNSAISVSRDVLLRKFIKKSLVDEAKFLASIGTAQMQQEMENKVMDIAKDKIEDSAESDETAPSLSDDELRNYIKDVMEEVKSIKK